MQVSHKSFVESFWPKKHIFDRRRMYGYRRHTLCTLRHECTYAHTHTHTHLGERIPQQPDSSWQARRHFRCEPTIPILATQIEIATTGSRLYVATLVHATSLLRRGTSHSAISGSGSQRSSSSRSSWTRFTMEGFASRSSCALRVQQARGRVECTYGDM